MMLMDEDPSPIAFLEADRQPKYQWFLTSALPRLNAVEGSERENDFRTDEMSRSMKSKGMGMSDQA